MNDKYNIQAFAQELDIDLQAISGLYSEYLKEVADNVEAMRLHSNRSDWNMLGRVVHNIKGISINLNITDMYELAKSFENELKNNKFDSVEAYISNISSLHGCIKKTLSDFFEEQSILIS